eukprot:TRINITY_DN5685_c0_g2_i2.p1 TRINITY_DN5685_c0_g2~~TRINITY_DN5685_c0_g2_i2.p1  ORF type:complete len:2031 (+),score=578.31 TRINITY_DN5685_c0_g2_i2:833-6094(+)
MVRMMCVVLKPYEIEDVLHNRFDARSRRLRLYADKPTDTVLLLIVWFTEYFNRFPELHLFSHRISPVVEAIDERVNFELSPFFVRDHIFLLLMQTLMAYNTQRTWGKDYFNEGPSRGDKDDQPPTVSDQLFNDMVCQHAFTAVQSDESGGGSAQQAEEADGGGGGQRRDVIQALFVALFNQKEWAPEDWGVDHELQHVIKMVLALGLCNSNEIRMARECLVTLDAGLQADFMDQEDDMDDDEGMGDDDEAGPPPVAKKKIGMHRGFIGEKDNQYTPAYQQLKPEEDFDGRLPLTKRATKNRNPRELDETEDVQDLLYELVELPDQELQENMRLDTNLWRRLQLSFPTFTLQSSAEKVWDVRGDLRKALYGLGLQSTHDEHFIQEFQCELHVDEEQRTSNHFAHLIKSSEDSQHNQVFFEVEMNGNQVVYLMNLTAKIARTKVSLQLFGAKQLHMRTRCLFESKGMRVTVANPRMVVLTNPKTFDPDVISRVIRIGARKNVATVRGYLDEAGGLLPHARDLAPATDGMSAAKRVIHHLMPKFATKVIDLLEDKCFSFEKQSVGLDVERLMNTIEKEHEEVIAMLSRSISFMVKDVFLDKLDLDNAELMQSLYPAFVDVFDEIVLDSVDDEEMDDIPRLLKVPVLGADGDEEGAEEVLSEERRLIRLQEWILRICHAVRVVAFVGTPKLNVAKGYIDLDADGDSLDMALSDNAGDNSNNWAACRALLKILQELFARKEAIEEQWGERVASSAQCVVNSSAGKLNLTYATEKATILCPFSYGGGGTQTPAVAANIPKLRRFFEESQVPEIDPLMLVTTLLYHPEATMRLEAFRLGCQIIANRNDILQGAFRSHTRLDMHLQKAMGFQFSSFQNNFKSARQTNTDMDMMAGMLKLIQQLCEGHNSELQEFLGEDYTAEVQDIFSAGVVDEDADDDKEEEDEDDAMAGQPNNVVQWTSQMIKLVLESMTGAQDWQASMTGRDKQYILVQQLFDTTAELIQGPNFRNQRLLLDQGICLDVGRLWVIVRIDEFSFRGLIQDNEDLADTWMELLESMRQAEISALRFLLSLLEELELNQDDADFAEMQNEVIYGKTLTIKRMVEELRPKVLCDKIITHWNLSAEADDPNFRVPPVVSEEDEGSNMAEEIIRPKREVECTFYTLDRQKEHCLEICAYSYSLFQAIFNAPEARTSLYRDMVIERPPAPDGSKYELSTYSQWKGMKTKVFNSFVDKVQSDHNDKYLHFLFGQVEIVCGSRLQRIFFFVPPAIRELKNQLLVHKWQEDCLVKVDRSSPEAQIDNFGDLVNGEYVSFVQHQYFLLNKPWPFNMAGEVIDFCINSTMLTTVIVNCVMILNFHGSYSKHSILRTDIHYDSRVTVYILTFFAGIHLFLSVILVGFYVVSYTSWIIDTQIAVWREENPREAINLNNPSFKIGLQLQIVFSDSSLLYKLFLLTFSFLGLYVNFLFNAVNTIDLCLNVPILSKVIESIIGSAVQVLGTMVLGCCIQYIFVAISFMSFGNGYGFADMDTSQCSTLMECLMGHFDYGFRSAPVWNSAKLTNTRFLFDYSYNLLVILIMAAIISGIIIDTFAELREKQKEVEDAMASQCFICSLTKSELERSGIKFEKHILEDHYMWQYARFLLYLAETPDNELTGPEDYVKAKIKENNNGFFPINRCIAIEAADIGEEHLEREVRVKDMDDFKANLKSIASHTEEIMKTDSLFKMEVKELRDGVQHTSSKIQVLKNSLTAEEDQDKKKKKKKAG